ncbi:hypothetical protein PG999_007561 [Apiospora kogelbergensis]|uniref:Secreted protein CSS2 C-terminal domain-containing protein n=1 Tax=Apiospora kogelbergensis TaxID=1337665 RepID=A0AAW0QNC5_9PEZI
MASLDFRGLTPDASCLRAHEYISIDLDVVENPSLSKRTPVQYCTANPSRSGVCIAAASFASAVAFGISMLAKGGSDAKECNTVHTGSTNDELDTIAGAMKKYISSQHGNICGVKCIKLDHGGTWRGYVTLGSTREDLSTYHCGNSYTFGDCGKGGNKDISLG